MDSSVPAVTICCFVYPEPLKRQHGGSEWRTKRQRAPVPQNGNAANLSFEAKQWLAAGLFVQSEKFLEAHGGRRCLTTNSLYYTGNIAKSARWSNREPSPSSRADSDIQTSNEQNKSMPSIGMTDATPQIHLKPQLGSKSPTNPHQWRRSWRELQNNDSCRILSLRNPVSLGIANSIKVCPAICFILE